MKFKFLLAFLFLYLNLHSQKSSEYDYNIPLPPESYQFKKRMLNNVSLYTGQPSIDIPIYTINLDGMEIPISISYNTGGIKVEEDATSVGLGWSLNIGGQITRNNHGAADERYFMNQDYNNTFGIGRLKTSIDPQQATQWGCNSSGEYGSRMQFYAKAFLAGNDKRGIYGTEDSRPDEFYYSFFGHSGKFMFSQELKKFVTFPLDDINISYLLGNRSSIPQTIFIDYFNVQLPNGYSLILGKDGTSSISQYGLTPFDQSWQLKKIISSKNKEVIYNYISADYSLFSNLSSPTTKIATGYIGTEEQVVVGSPESNTTATKEKLISEIIFPEGKISFSYGNRIDLLTGSKKLEEIKVYDNTGNLIKKIDLVQSYFNANVHLYSTDAVDKRLKLDAIRFYDTKNNVVENYNFDYYSFGKIPSKSSKAQDHWGYFNGKESNFSLFPRHIMPFHNVASNNGFNRDVDTLYTKTFSLKSIKFPEGAVKYYNYENHKCLTGATTGTYYDAISDERYAIKSPSFSVSGYDLKTFYPNPNASESNSFQKVFYSEPFETTIQSTSLKQNQVSLQINSNFPFQVPNYKNINAEFNNVSFYLQQKQSDGTFKDIKYYGTISKDQYTSGNIQGYFETGGKSTYRMKIIIVQNYFLSNPSEYNFYHNSSFTISYRDKSKDDVNVGGLRIKDIQTYTDSNLNSKKYSTYFKYLDDNKITSGKMMNVPAYIENISVYSPLGSRIDLGIRMSSTSTLSLYKTSGSNVGYTKVSQINYDNITKKESKEDYYYSFKEPLFSEITIFDDRREDEPQEWHRGKLLRKLSYNDNSIIREELYDYYGKEVEKNRGYVDEINYELLDENELCNNGSEQRISKHIFPSLSLIDAVTFPFDLKVYVSSLNKYPVNKYSIENFLPTGLKIPYFKIYTGFDKLKSKTTIDYFGNNSVSQTENYFYNYTPTSIQLSSQVNVNSKGETLETKYYYAQNPEMANEPLRNELLARNMVALPLREETYRDSNKLSEKKTQYGSFSSSGANQSIILPQYIYTKKGNVVPDQLEKKVTYQNYDTLGNLTQYTIENGNPVSIIWGYNQTLPIAKVENATNAQIAAALGVSNINTLNETNLPAINALRNNSAFVNCMISTYTHIPLVGINTITDPKGYTSTYTYDSFGRLESVRDNKGFILSENQYNYKH
ncbi:RHS repeat domain-containing protein [Flavobacterium sp. 3-218]